ncbi:MAG: helix-turn-helix domain-containing protein [Jatrophihabitantaceae bacterium]
MKIASPHTAPTRDAVVRLVQERGPLTAAALAQRLELSPAAVRRHLDALVADGIFAEVESRVSVLRPRGRGRPARTYALTDLGRAGLGHAYDDLASTALRYLRSTGGEAAVVAFAEHRADTLADRIRGRLAGQPDLSAERKSGLVAEILTEEGYAASAEPAGLGTQICQHHCPVAHVAAEFPELCEAETRALADAMGTYVQRLATIAHGDGVCTTHIPHAQPRERTTTNATTTNATTTNATTTHSNNPHRPVSPIPSTGGNK